MTAFREVVGGVRSFAMTPIVNGAWIGCGGPSKHPN
jgi:hypothetical protein